MKDFISMVSTIFSSWVKHTFPEWLEVKQQTILNNSNNNFPLISRNQAKLCAVKILYEARESKISWLLLLRLLKNIKEEIVTMKQTLYNNIYCSFLFIHACSMYYM